MAKPGRMAPPGRFPLGPSGWEEKLGVRNQSMQPSGLLTCKQVTAAPSPLKQPMQRPQGLTVCRRAVSGGTSCPRGKHISLVPPGSALGWACPWPGKSFTLNGRPGPSPELPQNHRSAWLYSASPRTWLLAYPFWERNALRPLGAPVWVGGSYVCSWEELALRHSACPHRAPALGWAEWPRHC